MPAEEATENASPPFVPSAHDAAYLNFPGMRLPTLKNPLRTPGRQSDFSSRKCGPGKQTFEVPTTVITGD